jgi:hypothetical protein
MLLKFVYFQYTILQIRFWNLFIFSTLSYKYALGVFLLSITYLINTLLEFLYFQYFILQIGFWNLFTFSILSYKYAFGICLLSIFYLKNMLLEFTSNTLSYKYAFGTCLLSVLYLTSPITRTCRFSIIGRGTGGHKSRASLHFVTLCLTSIGPLCRTSFISHFWFLEFWHFFWTVWIKFCTCVLGQTHASKNSYFKNWWRKSRIRQFRNTRGHHLGWSWFS